MTSAPRVRLAVDDRRERLLVLGRRLFSERPYESLSIDEIAAAAGVSKGLLYHYFRGKKEFYVETLRHALAEMVRTTAPDPDLPPLARLDACLDAWLAYVEQNGALYATITRGGAGLDPTIEALVEEYRRTVAGWILSALGIDAPRPAARAALRAWLGFGEGLSLDWVAHRDLPRETLKALLASALGAAIETARAHDPESGIGGRPAG